MNTGFLWPMHSRRYPYIPVYSRQRKPVPWHILLSDKKRPLVSVWANYEASSYVESCVNTSTKISVVKRFSSREGVSPRGQRELFLKLTIIKKQKLQEMKPQKSQQMNPRKRQQQSVSVKNTAKHNSLGLAFSYNYSRRSCVLCKKLKKVVELRRMNLADYI